MSVENEIKTLLSECFDPVELLLVNDSHKHRGHGNVPDSANSHFTLTIASDAFSDKTRIQKHQLVYGCLKALMDNPIHALVIHAYTPEEYAATTQSARFPRRVE
jgi:BolA family transcriptional regulator, general stress-responsive regulator